MQAVLFAVVVLAWGFSWYAIHLQLGETAASVSIFWRFAWAVIILWAGLIVTKRLKPVEWRQHGWFAVLGATLFSCNFMLIYGSETYVASGLVSVIFSMATIFNALNQWIFKGIRPAFRVVLGALVGVAGVVCLFSDQLSLSAHQTDFVGIFLALAGTYLFSLGNLASGQAKAAGTDLPNIMARSMVWGLFFLAIMILVQGARVWPSWSVHYAVGLAYLSVIATIIGFLAYLSLVARMGPSKAAYTTILSPIVALAVSAMLEHLNWRGIAFVGMALILSGNIIIFATLPAGINLPDHFLRNLFGIGRLFKKIP